MIFEICTDSIEGALAAQKYSVKRIELCSALHVGGLTPSFGLIKQCTMDSSVEVHVMLRHVAGDFNYSQSNIQIMMKDISGVKAAGANGVVLGCLTTKHEIDIENTYRLVETAKHFGLETTFHRAFDFCKDPIASLELLIELGVDRILTSGQQPTAIEGIDLISELVQQANGRIEIMAGSGVNSTSVHQLANTGIDALHFTAHKKIGEATKLEMGSKTIIDEEKISSILDLFK